MDISVVIPTRNRVASLFRLLQSLEAQHYPLKEAIIVDASDEKLSLGQLRARFPMLPILCLHSEPAVCVQRNLGIQNASSPYVFLCDDDIELPPSYVSTLMPYLLKNPQAGAVTGVILERDARGRFISQFPAPSLKQLFWTFIFQLPVWADLDSLSPSAANVFPLSLIKKFYLWRGNTFTLAGWPLVTNFSSPAFQTAIYGLGASIVRKDWLAESPFDEILDGHGIGDNYGVAINFPAFPGITVVTGAHAFHHKIAGNRLPYALVYFRRILALHYFMTRSERFSFFNRLFLVWSLVGNLLAQTIRSKKALAHATGQALKTIVFGKNPYLKSGLNQHGKAINPELT